MRTFSVHAVGVLTMLLGCVGVAGVGVSQAATAEVPASVTADCSKDVTAALVAWIKSVPDGSVLRFGKSACYRVDGTLTLTNRQDLTLQGAGATFQHGTDGREAPEPRTRMMFNVQQGRNITIKHTIVRGANPHAGVSPEAYVEELEAQHAYNFHGTQGVLLDHVQAYDVYGDFVYFGRGDGQPVRDAVVRHSHFERNGRQGIAITNAEDVVIEHNFIAQVRRATFDLEPNGTKWAIRRVTVQDNEIGPGRLLFFANHGAAAPIEDIRFIGNRLTGKAMNGSIQAPTGARRKNYTFLNNVSDQPHGNPQQAVLRVTGVDHIELRNNVQPMQAARMMSLATFQESSGIIVVGNQLLNATSSLKLGAGITTYCYNDNQIGNPLVLEPSALPCGP